MLFPTLLTTLGFQSPPLFPAFFCPSLSVGINPPLSGPAANLDVPAWPILVPARAGPQVCYTTSEEVRDAYLEKGFCGLPADFKAHFPDGACPPSRNIVSLVVAKMVEDLGWDSDGCDYSRASRWLLPFAVAQGLWRMLRVVFLTINVAFGFIIGLLATIVMDFSLSVCVLAAVFPSFGDFVVAHSARHAPDARAGETGTGTLLKSILRPYKPPVIRHVAFDLKPRTSEDEYDTDESDDSTGTMTPLSDDETDSNDEWW